MADLINIGAPGQVLSAGDQLALFLKTFGGEVLTAFSNASVTLGRHIERTITSGKSAQFPVVGRTAAHYLKKGQSLDDVRTNIESAEKTIVIDGLLVADCMIFDLDEAMAHYDVRSAYSKELGDAMAVANDGAVIAEIAKMVVADTENIPTKGDVKGTGKGKIISEALPAADIGETEAMGAAIMRELLKAKTVLSDNKVPAADRYCYIRPVALNAMLANKDVLNKLYGAEITIRDNKAPMVYGFELIETPDLTTGGAAVNEGVVQGNGHVFPAEYKDTCMFVVAHRSAVGILTLKGLNVENNRRGNYQANEITTSYSKGYGGLRPEAACIGVVTTQG